MKTRHYKFKLQRGVASLLIAVILLVSMTLVVLFTSKTVLMETKMITDDYRTTQATAAAQAGMDQAMAYFLAGGIDYDLNGVDFTTPTLAQMPSEAACSMPITPASPITLTSGTVQRTFAQFYFVNTPTFDHDNDVTTPAIANPCDCSTDDCFDSAPNDKAMVIAKGWSDDCTAVRTVSQCVGVFPIFNSNKGPSQPMVTHGGVGISGNMTIINRYTASTIWTGADVSGDTNASFGTWLAPPDGVTACGTKNDTSCLNKLNDLCPSSGCDSGSAVLASNNTGGVGPDMIENDNTLKNMLPDEMFAIFFGSNTRNEIKALADTAGQAFTNVAALKVAHAIKPLKGLIWLDQANDTALPNDLGATSPVILVTATGAGKVTTGTEFHGVLYSTGQIDMGNRAIFGSLVVESNDGIASNGNGQVVFVPMGKSNSTTTTPLVGTLSAIAGSWRDW